MTTGGWKAKWAAFRAELARKAEGRPTLTLVTPKRASGEHVTPRNWHEPAEQARLFGLPLCAGCGLAQIVGAEGLLPGDLCRRCYDARQASASPGPSAA